MEQATLTAKARQEAGTTASRKLRLQGKIPAVVYGHKQAPQSLLLNADEVSRIVVRRIKMVNLSVDGKEELVLVKDVQLDTFGEDVLHLDFERIAMDELLDLECPVELVGTSKGQAAGGVVEHPVTDLRVRCLPRNIPEAIKVSISHLEIGNTIHVKDIKAPEGVEILNDPESILVTIRAPKEAEEAAAPAAAEEGAAAAEPELIRRPKAEEEEEAEGKA